MTLSLEVNNDHVTFHYFLSIVGFEIAMYSVRPLEYLKYCTSNPHCPFPFPQNLYVILITLPTSRKQIEPKLLGFLKLMNQERSSTTVLDG